MSVLFLLIASAAACIGFPRTAFAGYYKVAYTGGSSSPIGYYADYSMSDRHDCEGFANLGNSPDPGTASCSGAITATFTWTPSSVGDTSLPPKGVIIIESSSVSWGTNAGTQAAGSCSDGLGGTPSNYIEESNPSGRQVMYSGRGESSGNRTTPLHDPGVTITRTCNPQAQASGRDAQAFVQYRAEIQTKTVSISRGGSPRGETVDADGTKHGDTIYSWENYSMSVGLQDAINWQSFYARPTGSWSSYEYLTYNWNPAASWATVYSNSVSMPFGIPKFYEDSYPAGWVPSPHWVGSPTGPNQYTVTYTLTDSRDGGSASDSYVLTLHDQVENLTDAVTGEVEDVDTGGREVGEYDITLRGPIDREFQVTPGVWSLELGTSEISKWFPVFGISYQMSVESVTRHAPWMQNIAANHEIRLVKKNLWNHHDVRWNAYDADGEIPVDPSVPGSKQQSVWKELQDINYRWEGPYRISGGF